MLRRPAQGCREGGSNQLHNGERDLQRSMKVTAAQGRTQVDAIRQRDHYMRQAQRSMSWTKLSRAWPDCRPIRPTSATTSRTLRQGQHQVSGALNASDEVGPHHAAVPPSHKLSS